MKRFTNALFAAALLAGGASLAIAPAAAQKKDKKAEGAGMKLYLAYLRDPDGNKLCGFYRVHKE